MSLITVRAYPDRVAFDAPRGGKPIPTDRFVTVPDSPHIRRLAEHWGDIEIQAEQPATAAVPEPDRPTRRPRGETAE